MTGTWITAAEATEVDYWARHMREPVRFAAGLHTIRQDPERILLEVGPGQTLSTCAQQHPDKAAGQVVLASLPRAQDSDMACLLHTLGQLWLAGVAIDWTVFHHGEHRYRIPLPTYPFERQHCWDRTVQRCSTLSVRPDLQKRKTLPTGSISHPGFPADCSQENWRRCLRTA